mmetsp:Transcript_118208/g.306989  ORF Transcript_118208/g.306989 Transcript_118208/m.306989 type:complete len:233 (-) Transcript_118208:1176-1874(-)
MVSSGSCDTSTPPWCRSAAASRGDTLLSKAVVGATCWGGAACCASPPLGESEDCGGPWDKVLAESWSFRGEGMDCAPTVSAWRLLRQSQHRVPGTHMSRRRTTTTTTSPMISPMFGALVTAGCKTGTHSVMTGLVVFETTIGPRAMASIAFSLFKDSCKASARYFADSTAAWTSFKVCPCGGFTLQSTTSDPADTTRKMSAAETLWPSSSTNASPTCSSNVASTDLSSVKVA